MIKEKAFLGLPRPTSAPTHLRPSALPAHGHRSPPKPNPSPTHLISPSFPAAASHLPDLDRPDRSLPRFHLVKRRVHTSLGRDSLDPLLLRLARTQHHARIGTGRGAPLDARSPRRLGPRPQEQEQELLGSRTYAASLEVSFLSSSSLPRSLMPPEHQQQTRARRRRPAGAHLRRRRPPRPLPSLPRSPSSSSCAVHLLPQEPCTAPRPQVPAGLRRHRLSSLPPTGAPSA